MTNSPLGAVLKRNIGILIGLQGAVIGLALGLVGAGEFGLLLRFLLPTSLIALALAGGAILTLELIAIARPEDNELRMQTLWAVILTDIGLLLLVFSEWVMPEVQKSEGFRDVVHKTYSLTTVPVWVPALLLAGGCLLFARALRRLLTDAPEKGPST